MPRKKRERLKIELVQNKPHKTYKAEIEDDHHIEELCQFLRANKDREVGIVINGKHTKFNSHAGKKRFATGYEQGSGFIIDQAKELFKEMQTEMNQLKTELRKYKQEVDGAKSKAQDAAEKLRVNEAVKKLRQAAFADREAEINEDRALLKSRLDKVEPIIRLIKAAKGDGDLQKAFRLAKKNRV